HLHLTSDPSRRRSVISRFDLDTAVHMNGAIAVLVVAERLQRQRLQAGFLFGEHRRYLPFGGAVDAGVGPAFFPVVQIGLGLFQALETLAFQRRLFGMSNSGFDLTLVESHRMQTVWEARPLVSG